MYNGYIGIQDIITLIVHPITGPVMTDFCSDGGGVRSL
jgi:hypothetical protein